MAGGLMLALGFGLFVTNIIGGGDAKLMAAVGLWVGPAFVAQFAFLTAIIGGGLALTIFLYACSREQVWRNARWATIRSVGSQPVPYGIAIALSAIAVILGLPSS